MQLPAPKMLVTLSALVLLAIPQVSCVTTTASSVQVTKVACNPDVLKPITWSAKDTPKTVLQVKEHNAVWKALCRPGT